MKNTTKAYIAVSLYTLITGFSFIFVKLALTVTSGIFLILK
ncbi:hypothetical protein SAMN04488156_102649 [Bacillus sp. 166amftsu]|nr:hypothetical protein SAMN04488156_102649 [Bacillus sp. 166amftsu]